MKKQRAIVRRYPFMKHVVELIIFFNDQLENDYRVQSWMEQGEHGTASLDFYHITKKVDKETAQKFLDKYCKLYNCEGEFVLREILETFSP